MKKLLGLVFIFVSCYASAQVDTLTYVPQELRKECNNGKCKYWVDSKSVSQEEYEVADAKASTIERCKPCWLKSEDKKDNVTYEGYFFTDCCIGAYIERYSSGVVKVKGQCKTPKDVNDPNLYHDGYCRREGIWTYYKMDGTVEKTETYKNGNLVTDK